MAFSPMPYLRKMSVWGSPLPEAIVKSTKVQAEEWWKNMRLARLAMRTFVHLVCIIACAVQCEIILDMYLDYPTTVYVYMERMAQLETPGITVCNNNRLMLTKLKHFNHTFRDEWQYLTSMENGDDANDTEINLKRQALVDGTLRSLIEDAPIYTTMRLGHAFDEFLDMDFFKCASDEEHPTRPCKSFANIVTTAQSIGNCFTLFHRSYTKLSDDVEIKAGLSQAPVLKGSSGQAVDIEISDKPFRPNEVIRLKVNFLSDEYTTLNEPVMGSVAIHDANEAPGIRTKALNIEPGHFYDFFITKQTSVLLPAPYVTDCMKYVQMNQGHYEDSGDEEENINSIFKWPLSKADCVVGCMGSETVKKCDCWPPELPFLANSIPKGKGNDLRWCDWDTDTGLNMTKVGNQSISWFNYCFSVHENRCQKFCKDECKTDRYAVTVASRVWPSIERLEHSKRRDYLLEQRNCCAVISIRYWNTEHTIHKFQSKFEPIELMSYLSGLVSMWLGISVLKTFTIMELAVERFLDFKEITINKKKVANRRWRNTRNTMRAIREFDRSSRNSGQINPLPARTGLMGLYGSQSTGFNNNLRKIVPEGGRNTYPIYPY